MLKSKLAQISFCLPVCLVLLLTSCNFFGGSEITVIPCNTSSVTVTDSVTSQDGIISLVDVDINGTAVQKWVILPATPSGAIYVPCNLPMDARKKSKSIDFNAFILNHSPNPQDTVLNGFTFIELTYLEND